MECSGRQFSGASSNWVGSVVSLGGGVGNLLAHPRLPLAPPGLCSAKWIAAHPAVARPRLVAEVAAPLEG